MSDNCTPAGLPPASSAENAAIRNVSMAIPVIGFVCFTSRIRWGSSVILKVSGSKYSEPNDRCTRGTRR